MTVLKENKSLQDKIMVIEDPSNIIGMPPGTHVSDQMMRNTMPIADIMPCEPSFVAGMTLFQLDDAWRGSGNKAGKGYLDILERYRYTINGNSLKVAFLADNFPTDTFNNEYGETFLDQYTQVGSGAVSDITQMMGGRNATDVLGQLAQKGKEIGGVVGFGAGMADSAAGGLAKLMNSLSGATGDLGVLGKKIASSANAIMAGARVDFPQVWKNSRFSPSYTMTVRLYNPNPGSMTSTQKYIAGPICALLLLGMPRTQIGDAYSWPFLCRVTCPGIYNLKSAYISSISVVKGGDRQSIAWNQRLAMCDIRIDFGSLYDTLLVDEEFAQTGDRPTLENYLDGLVGEKVVEDYPRDSLSGESPVSRMVNKGAEILEKNLSAEKNTSTSTGNYDSEPKSRIDVADRTSTSDLMSGSNFYSNTA